jgi:hypothetical protein
MVDMLVSQHRKESIILIFYSKETQLNTSIIKLYAYRMNFVSYNINESSREFNIDLRKKFQQYQIKNRNIVQFSTKNIPSLLNHKPSEEFNVSPIPLMLEKFCKLKNPLALEIFPSLSKFPAQYPRVFWSNLVSEQFNYYSGKNKSKKYTTDVSQIFSTKKN